MTKIQSRGVRNLQIIFQLTTSSQRLCSSSKDRSVPDIAFLPEVSVMSKMGPVTFTCPIKTALRNYCPLFFICKMRQEYAYLLLSAPVGAVRARGLG